jgi:hypothetical protein
MSTRTAQARVLWERALRTARLSTAERLVAGQLPGFVTAQTGAHVDLAELATCCCLPVATVTASVDALAARQLLHTHADGRLVLGVPGGAP